MSNPARTWRPAARWAQAEAGMTPPLAAIATPLRSAPAAIGGIPGSRRLAHTNPAMTAYVARWIPRCRTGLPEVATTVITT